MVKQWHLLLVCTALTCGPWGMVPLVHAAKPDNTADTLLSRLESILDEEAEKTVTSLPEPEIPNTETNAGGITTTPTSVSDLENLQLLATPMPDTKTQPINEKTITDPKRSIKLKTPGSTAPNNTALSLPAAPFLNLTQSSSNNSNPVTSIFRTVLSLQKPLPSASTTQPTSSKNIKPKPTTPPIKHTIPSLTGIPADESVDTQKAIPDTDDIVALPIDETIDETGPDSTQNQTTRGTQQPQRELSNIQSGTQKKRSERNTHSKTGRIPVRGTISDDAYEDMEDLAIDQTESTPTLRTHDGRSVDPKVSKVIEAMLAKQRGINTTEIAQKSLAELTPSTDTEPAQTKKTGTTAVSDTELKEQKPIRKPTPPEQPEIIMPTREQKKPVIPAMPIPIAPELTPSDRVTIQDVAAEEVRRAYDAQLAAEQKAHIAEQEQRRLQEENERIQREAAEEAARIENERRTAEEIRLQDEFREQLGAATAQQRQEQEREQEEEKATYDPGIFHQN